MVGVVVVGEYYVVCGEFVDVLGCEYYGDVLVLGVCEVGGGCVGGYYD